MIADSIVVRLALTTRSVPPVAPVDSNTGEPPAIWRGEDIDFQIGIFDAMGFCVDLSNVDFLEVDIFPTPLPAQRILTNQTYAPYSMLPFPSVPPAPLLSVTIPAIDITPVISWSNWEDGLAQQATASFGWRETLSLNLGGKSSRPFGILVHGITDGLRKLTYGGGLLTVYESGEQGIYLPNLIAPLDVPEATILLIEPNQQLLFSETISVEGRIEIEGILAQVS